jgi:hypothetical protein
MLFGSSFSSESYWSEFEITDDDLDFIINLLLEREIPLQSEEMSAALVQYRLERLEEEAKQANESEHSIYLPADEHTVGQVFIFPVIGNLVGSVVSVRAGENPDVGPFKVIQVSFGDDRPVREFASCLEDHILNQPPEPDEEVEALKTVKGVIEAYGASISERIEIRLHEADDIINIAGKWFPTALLADINEGHLNLAEAVLDVSEGGPLATKELLGHMEMPASIDPLLREFSLDYALQENEHFDEVGPAGQTLWFLKRLEPPEVLYTPPRLEYVAPSVDRRFLTDDLLALEQRLDDELSKPSSVDEDLDEVVISLLFPHWRVGALPLSARLRPFFPTAYEAPRIRFILQDAHSGDEFPGWVVRDKGYVFGLDQWYQRYDIPTGGLVKIRRGEQAGKVIIEADSRHSRSDWIRTVTIDEDGNIGFTMLKQTIGSAYDDLMVVGLIDPVALDEAWLRGKQRFLSVDRLVAYVFRELARLTPQSAVHAQSLYSGVNVIQRLPPEIIFAELTTQPYYEHVGDLYWRFDQGAWSRG